MPLALADVGTENLILKVGGSPEVKKHLEDLGFVAGGTATVVASMSGNIIVEALLNVVKWGLKARAKKLASLFRG